MHTSVKTLNGRHTESARCKKGADRMRQRKAIEKIQHARKVVISIGDEPLESVTQFRYLGRPITFSDDDWPAIHHNLTRARKQWAMVSQVLVREKAEPRIAAMFYKAVVQSVLLYGAETWVITRAVLDKLEGFHKRVARRLANKLPYYVPLEDKWIYPDIKEALKITGMYTMEHYINTVDKQQESQEFMVVVSFALRQ